VAIREASRIHGAIWDVTKLSGLSESECHVLFVSARTLYILANLAENEVNWYSRYYSAVFDGGYVDTVEAGDPEVELVDRIANNFRLEVISVNCDLLPVLEQLVAATEDISARLLTIDATLQGISAGVSAIGDGALPESIFDEIEETLDDIGTVLGIVGTVIAT
jgi:hypothetical protein